MGGVFLCSCEVRERKEGDVEAEGRYSGISDGDRQVAGSEERE